MLQTRTRKILMALLAATVLIAALLLARNFSNGADGTERQQLLQLIPTGSSAVIYVDLDEFRESSFLAKLYEWAPRPAEDSEYAQFVRETGFSYERDLHRVVVAISKPGVDTNFVAIADGKFDRKKIEAVLFHNGAPSQHGKWKIFRLDATVQDKPLSVAFLSDNRIALSNSEDLAGGAAAASGEPGHAEWNARFERLAGTPVFAVIHRDPALQSALGNAAPGGYQSPQLSALLNQLQWLSIAGKPDGDLLRVVADGETVSESAMSQLSQTLQGILLLAQNGLNDPKVRQQMNPAERDAYVELLRGAEVQKIDRGEWKSVRVVLSVTPKFLEVAKAKSAAPPATEKTSGGTAPGQTTASKAKKKK